jgi:serine/threonine protein kinase
MNVLIDDNKKAVLYDFGLSHVKADITSRTAKLGTAIVTVSHNWMSSECIKGRSVKKPSDIYAFGMVIFEVIFIPSFVHHPPCPNVL